MEGWRGRLGRGEVKGEAFVFSTGGLNVIAARALMEKTSCFCDPSLKTNMDICRLMRSIQFMKHSES